MGYSVATIELRDRFELFNRGGLCDLYVAADDARPLGASVCDAMCSSCEGVCSEDALPVDVVRSHGDLRSFIGTVTSSQIDPDENPDEGPEEDPDQESPQSDDDRQERHEHAHNVGNGREHEHEHEHGDDVPQHEHDPRTPTTQQPEKKAS